MIEKILMQIRDILMGNFRDVVFEDTNITSLVLNDESNPVILVGLDMIQYEDNGFGQMGNFDIAITVAAFAGDKPRSEFRIYEMADEIHKIMSTCKIDGIITNVSRTSISKVEQGDKIYGCRIIYNCAFAIER